MGVKAGKAENSDWAKRSTQGQAAEGAILKAQFLQGLASGPNRSSRFQSEIYSGCFCW